MSALNELVDRHIDAMLAEASAAGMPTDVVGRRLLSHVLRVYALTRSWDDIAAELQFTADNLHPDTEFAFIRP